MAQSAPWGCDLALPTSVVPSTTNGVPFFTVAVPPTVGSGTGGASGTLHGNANSPLVAYGGGLSAGHIGQVDRVLFNLIVAHIYAGASSFISSPPAFAASLSANGRFFCNATLEPLAEGLLLNSSAAYVGVAYYLSGAVALDTPLAVDDTSLSNMALQCSIGVPNPLTENGSSTAFGSATTAYVWPTNPYLSATGNPSTTLIAITPFSTSVVQLAGTLK